MAYGDVIYIKNKSGRVVQVNKELGNSLIAKRQAEPYFKPDKDVFYKMSKTEIIEKLQNAKIEHDPLDTKDVLFNLLPKQ